MDNGATVGGIAISGTTGAGVWSFSLDGTIFAPVGAVSVASALLLPSTAELCYTPHSPAGESATFSYRAWDATAGTPGTKADTSTSGGTTAFSSASDTATVTLDYTPPSITSTSPSLTGGTLTAGAVSLAITFSETVVGGGAAANYQLQSVGPDGLLGTADDVAVPLTVTYSGTTATLSFSPLAENVYRLTVDDTITDRVGNKLDGNSDGVPGGNGVRDFVVVSNGSTIFGAARTFSTGGTGAFGVATGDFNNDGNLDIAVTNNSSPGTVGILLGDGNGGFSAATTFSSGGSSPVSVVAGDFNRDGNLDLVVTNNGSNNVAILLGNGSGGFSAPKTYSSGGSDPRGAGVGDFNHDGKLDVAVGNWPNGNVGVLLGDGLGGFGATTTYSTGGSWPTPGGGRL